MANSPQIAVINESTVLNVADIPPVITALQTQVDQHFAPIWGRTASLLSTVFSQSNMPPAETWWLVLLDDSDQAGALGYHDLTSEGLPLSKIFAKTGQQYGLKWSVTASHELIEMLGDPYIDLAAEDPNTRDFYAYELCDPCENDSDGYDINGVTVSDFITPFWFSPAQSSHPMDYRQLITQALALRPGGYISIYRHNTWIQQNAESVSPSRADRIDMPGSRRERRMRGKSNWQLSQPSLAN